MILITSDILKQVVEGIVCNCTVMYLPSRIHGSYREALDAKEVYDLLLASQYAKKLFICLDYTIKNMPNSCHFITAIVLQITGLCYWF